MDFLSRRYCCVSGMSGEEDFRRAEIWSRVATVSVLIQKQSMDDDSPSIDALRSSTSSKSGGRVMLDEQFTSR